MAEMDINEMLSSVTVKNRVTNEAVRITFDGRLIVWQPGESKQMPRKLADWFQAKSLYLFHPGDPTDPENPQKFHYKLAILGVGQDETPLTREDVNVPELLDAQNMPELRRVDPKTGEPMRRVYINPRSTGARDDFVAKERQVTKDVSSAIVKDAAERIADAATGVSETEIGAAVAELTGTGSDAPA